MPFPENTTQLREAFFQASNDYTYRTTEARSITSIKCPYPMDAEFYVERFGIILLTTLVGIGVSQFIRYGMLDSAFKKILNIDEYSEKEQRFQKVTEPVGRIYWLVITLIYLIWSFTTMDWHISWIVWPVAGILWAIITSILKLYNPRDNDPY